MPEFVAIVRLNDKHYYVLPGDSVGQHFVDVRSYILATVWDIIPFDSFILVIAL